MFRRFLLFQLPVGLIGAFAVSPLASAQTPAPGAEGGQQSRAQAFIARFEAANTTHDGHLTLEQAQAGHLPMIAKNFSAIDKDGKGYVTLSDIQAWRHARAEQRRATQGATPG
jgi:hypothetical protein